MTTTEKPVDYRSLLDKEHLGAWDFPRDVTLTISRWDAVKVGRGDKEKRKPILYFAESKTGKGLVCNVTNCKTISKVLGTTNVVDWVGKRITLYAAKTDLGGEQVDCVRVRPQAPKQTETP